MFSSFKEGKLEGIIRSSSGTSPFSSVDIRAHFSCVCTCSLIFFYRDNVAQEHLTVGAEWIAKVGEASTVEEMSEKPTCLLLLL